MRLLARTAGVPLKSVLLAAHLRALNVLTSSHDVVTGLVSHGRTETADSERVLGLFLNTLPFRRRLAGGTWLELVQETFAAERELLPFRRYPLARMQQDLGNDAPLFETLFNFTHFHVYDEMQSAGGVKVLGFEGVADTNFTLAVAFSLDEGSQLSLELQYDTAELSAAQIEAVGHDYVAILESMARNPLERYDRQSLLSPEERQKIVYDWNDTACVYQMAMTVSQLFEQQAERTPQAIALTFADQQLNYAELNARANQLAHHLRSLGVTGETPVGVMMDHSLEMVVALLGILKAGGVYVPLDPEYPDERLKFMARDAGLELVVTQDKLAGRISETKSLRLDVDWPNESKDNLSVSVSADSLAYIIYTSGSSGAPKGAMVTHGGMLNCLQWMQQRYELSEHDAFLMHTSLNFDPSVWEVFWPLMVGARVVVVPSTSMLDSSAFRYLAEQKVTCAYFVPSLLGVLVKEPGLSECRSLRYVISGGEKLPMPVMREFHELSRAELHHSYGPTETAIAATEWTCESGAERVLMGRPIGNTQIYVLDQQMEPLPVGVTGELYIGGAGVGRGYAGRAELTAERFVPDRFSGEVGTRLYRTGDMVRYDDEGRLEFIGRLDEQVKVRGYRIELGEIEAVLRRHEQVRDVVVVLSNERLVAYVVSKVPTSELRAYLKAQLPEYMTPSFFVTLNELPLMPNGKINRRALPAPEGAVAKAAEYEAPRTQTEELLAGLWASVLHVDRIGVNDDFFALGGHSLLATQLVSRVREAFGVELPLRELFERPTVAGLAQQVEVAVRGGLGLMAPPLVPVSREHELPLSYAQQRLWFLDQLEPSGSFYNLPAAVRLRGALNVAALEQTLSEVVRRHEALRTTFVAVAGEPRQVIAPFTPVPLPVFELSKLETAEREAETQRLLSEEASRPFDLARGPLVRACLVRLGAEEHVALVTMHHIISDGWSTGIFIREVAALYTAFLNGEKSSLAELPIQYADFAHWQRGWLQGEVLAAQLEYWREALAEMPAMLELPTDRPRPREQTFNGAMAQVELSAELTAQLRALSQRERVTLFMTLLAAFQALLFRHSGQDDIVVGTPIANRRYGELEDLLGFFVNSLALRARSLQTLTFTELLQQVREVTLAAYAHQDLPFEKLVEELQPERDLSRNPLFQVQFALQNAPASALELPGLTLEGQALESRVTRFDLECHLWEDAEVLRGVFVYNTDLFDHATIERLVVNFETLLQSIVANPAEAVASLRLLRAEDERQLLYGWNDTDAEFPAGAVHELFARQVERTPHETAVVFEDASLTYLELDQRSNRLAAHLQSMGVGPDTIVGVMLERSVEMLVGVLGVLKAGGAYLPLDPEYPAERVQFMLADAAVRVLLTQTHLVHNVDADVNIIALDAEWERQAEEFAHAAVTGDNLAYIIYTSGSTGQPKGVAMTHGALVNLLHWQMRRSRNAPRTLQFASLSFDVSFQEIFSTWCAGGTLVLLREETRRDASALWRLLISERIERLFLPFVALQFLAEAAERDEEFPTSLREVIASGEQLRITRHIRNLFARLKGCTLDNQIGPSETHVISALLLAGDAAEWPDLPAIGRPVSNARLYVLDKQMRPTPIGVPGLMYIAGDSVSRGYLKRPEMTAERYVPNPFSDSGERLYRSGDVVRYLPTGDLEWLRREDDQVKIRGYRVELGEIEAAFANHPSVREAVVVVRVEARGEKRLVAYVVSEREVVLKVEELRQALRAKLPEYMVPSAIVLLDELPLTPSGKINRRALPEPESLLAEEVEAPRTPTEELLVGLWANVLHVDRVGINDDFFELGGHSLLATQLVSRVREAFAVELPLRELFARPTVAGLAEAVEAELRGGVQVVDSVPLVPVSREQQLPVSHAQQRLWFLDELEPGLATYNIPGAVRLKGQLDVDALQRTFSEVVRRHEALRTTFVTVNGQPVQVIAPASPLPMPAVDLSGLPEAEREAKARELAMAEAGQPFDLSVGPLVRVQLLRLGEEDHVVLFTMHHMVTDGWSTGILVREVAALYEAYIEGRESPLPELEIQYADYAVWQREWLQGEVLDQQLAYWREQLEELPVLQLPADKPRPPVQSHRGQSVSFALPASLTAELKQLSNTEGVTLYMTLLAAFKILLWRYSGQSDVVVGTPIAGRNHLATEGLIGLFVNTLVLRTNLSGNPSFSELLERVREVTLGAYAHQDLPFEKLVEELQPERDMSRSPLFQVLFVLQNATAEILRLPGLQASEVTSDDETAKFDLALGLSEINGELHGLLQYSTDLFAPATIERLVQHYELLLQGIANNSERQLSQLPLLLDEDQRRLLAWNDTDVAYDLEKCVHQLFEAQASQTPDATALVAGQARVSYGELQSRAEKLARRLRREGIGPEQRVGILVGRGAAMVVAPLGVLKAGGAYVPLDAAYPLERLSLMAEDAQLSALVAEEGLNAEFVRPDVKLVRLHKASGECIDDAVAPEEELPAPNVTPENLAYVIYTSGSTGRPKGVAITHRSAVALVHWARDVFPASGLRGVLASTSLNFDLSVFELFVTLSSGGQLILADNALHLATLAAADEVTLINTVPSAMAELLRIGAVPDSVQTVNLAGEALPTSLVQQIYEQTRTRQVWNLYGPSEDTTYSTAALIEKNQSGPMVIGRPIANTQAYICDEMLEPVPVGVTGQLLLAGEGLARGYIGRPELTAERFLPDPFSSEGGGRLYLTGDLARYRTDGQIEFLGRADSQVKLRGFRIELGEIEEVLRRHEQIRDAVVVVSDERLVAYVVSEAPTSELRAYLKAQLPEYMTPSFFVALEELPRLPNGKINRRALPTPEGLGVEQDYQEPRTQTEELLSGLFASVLRAPRVGVYDNFFELGGHSLLATQLVSRVREAFGVELPLRELFERPTVAGLAQQVEVAVRGGLGLMAPPLVPVSREHELPLSYAQQRLWFLDQLEPSGSFYNLPAAVRLRGALNVAALEQTLSEVVRRHEALRTTFVAVAGEPRQVIAPFTPVPLPVFDLSKLETAEREAETQRLLSEEASQPFDLARGPLVRACLVRLGAEEHVALVTMHHIISDGWSTGIFIREVAALYTAFLNGAESSLAELPIQYADFAHWQRGWLQGEVLAAQLDYWREALAEMPAMLELPTDRPRPREQTFNGAMAQVELPAELTSQLRALSQRERVTLFMTLLAAFQTLLFRHSGQDDIVVGTPIANRRYSELEDLLGFFVNSLALRARSLQTLTFTELLQQVREVTLAAYAHQDLPFEKLVEELQPERDLSRNPLFQVQFALQNAPASALELPGLTLEGQALESRVTRFDLECHLRDDGDVLRGIFVYNTDLFDQTTIERLVANFETLLQSIVANPAEAVASLRLLRAEDERQLLYGWNDTYEEFPAGAVHELFARQVARTPQETAVVFEDVSLTYLELDQRSNRLAAHLQSMGVEPDTIVGVMLERSVEMLVGVLGVLKAGGAYLPLDPEYPAERVQFMLADAAVRVLLTQTHLAHNVAADVEIIALDTDWETQAEEPARAAVTGDNLAYIIYTSGSTGQPKGVAMTHGPLVNLLHWQMRRSRNAPRTLQFASLSFDVSFQEIFSTWCAGGTLVLLREETRRDASALWRLLISERIERLFLPFVALQFLAEAAERDEESPASLREVIASGEQLRITRHIRNLFARLKGCTLDNQIGPSETHVISALMLDGDAAAWPDLPAIGRPVSNARLYVLDKQMRPTPMGVPGLMYIAGDNVSRGYLKRPEMTAERYVPNPFSDSGERLYRSGDVVRYLRTGELEWLRREDDQVKIRGYRVELGEIEAAFARQPSVREAVVVVRVEARGEKRLVAYVVGEVGAKVEDLRQALRAKLPEYMVPSAIVLLDELPLTPSGKINRRALPEPDSVLSEEVEAPRTPTEELLVGLWANVLHVGRVGINDDFFELGGHSLLATQLVSRVREAFGVELPLRELFARPTVAGLAEAVEATLLGGVRQMAPPLLPVSREQQLPLLHAQERLWFLDELEPGLSTYNIPGAVRLKGQLDVDALQRTFSEVVRRHEVLRTTFVAVNGQPVQVIAPASPLPMPVVDLSGLPEAERESKTLELAMAEAGQPFDLSVGPLVRVQLLRLGAEDHVVLFTMHHMVTDGWSTGILVREVAALYEAYIEGRESPLPELEIQYADYAVWQREWLQGEVLEQQLAYWREQLADLPVLQLPADKPRPPVQSHRGQSVSFALPASLTAELKQLSNAEGVTLYMTLLAAFKILLWRYSGQNDVVVGTPIAGRNHLATEGLIGLFVNTLVLRTNLSGNPSFSELLDRVREVTLGAYAHQDLPFEKLVEELQPERDMSRSPLFQVLFVLQNAPAEILRLPGLEASEVTANTETAKFALTLGLSEVNGELHGSLQYSTDLFEPATIERLVQHYELLLEGIANQPERQLSQLPLLLDEDRRRLVEWNDTRVAFANDKCVHELFEEQVSRTPNAVAVTYGDAKLTYAELNTSANQLAQALQAAGVGPEVLVGVLLERSLKTIVTLLAIFKAGGAYVPLDPAYPGERLRFMLEDARARVLLTQPELFSILPETEAEVLFVDERGQATVPDLSVPRTSQQREGLAPAPENLAYVIYTSGSTGRPKGVAITHRSAVALVHWARDVFPPSVLRGVLASTSLNFDLSVFELFVTLSYGGQLILADNALHLATLAAADEVTLINTVPSAMAELLRIGAVPDSVQTINLAGEALPTSLVQQIYEQTRTQQVWNLYGPSEDTTYSTAALIEKNQSGPMVIGRPIANTQAYICDETLEPVPVGVAGQLLLAGEGLARGYIGRPELTAERLLPDPFSSEGGGRLYLTGDLARYRADGQIEFLGRGDSQVKLRGFRIELGEIEEVLRRHEQIRDAVVVVSDERLVAYVVSEAPTSELRAYLKAQLPEYMTPSFFVALEELPRLPNGKINRRALPAPEGIGVEQDYQEPRTQTEELLSGLFASVLRAPRVGVHGNFFELGGHSLLATQLVSRVREAFGVELPLRELFARPTVASLAEQVEAELRGGVRVVDSVPLVPVSREQQLPLLYAQERLWFLDELEPGLATYNIPGAVRLKGQLDVDALQRTFSEVVRRHEVLRTTFVAVNGQPVQVIAPASPLPMPVVDLSGLPEREAKARELAMAEAGQPFDLSVGPLVRVQLLRLGEEDHVVLFTMHHMVTDGWSTGILVREVAALYEAYIEGRESPLPELTIQYADYAVWQREWLQGEVLDQQLAYWREQLADLPVLQLPADKPRPPVQSHRGQSVSFSLPASLTAELKQLSNAEGVTLYMTLLAAFKILLWRYSGQSDVVVGTPIAGRNHLATEGLIGLFVNTLVLRTSLSGHPSFSELLDRVREVTLGAYAHQDLPFEKLVEELQPERDMSRSPLFQVLFVLQNATAEILRLPGLEASEIMANTETAKFDLTLGLTESGGELYGSLQYNVDLFEAATIERLVQHYELLLQSIATQPDQQLSQLPLLLDDDRRKLLESNGTRVVFANDKCVHELFEEQVSRTPNAVAVMYEEQRLTYAELNQRADQLARQLRSLGVGPEVLVGLSIERSLDLVVGILGILKAGGAYLPLDPTYPRERLQFMIDDAKPAVILTPEGPLATDYTDQSHGSDPDLIRAFDPDHPCYVIYTSGSTGKPKGVMVTHRNVVRLFAATKDSFAFDERDVWTLFHSYAFDFSVWEMWSALLYGGRLVIIPYAVSRSPEAFYDLLVRERVTVLNQTPSAFRQLSQIDEKAPRSLALRLVIFGGEALDFGSLGQWFRDHGDEQPQLVNMYGITETTVHVTERRIRATEATSDAGSLIGRPLADLRGYVMDEQMELLPVGVPGELYVAGDGVARGYLGRPELTAERFVPDPFSAEPGARLYRTGDVVRYRSEGELEYMGRVDQQVKIRGFRIELGEIEAVLRRHPQVREALVMLSEEEGDKRLVAYVAGDAQASELRAYVKEQLPDYMTPSAFVLMDAFPLTANGKIDRRALPSPDQSTTSDSELMAPRDVLELQLSQIWKDVLRREHVGLRDNFFDLGGHSLLAVRLVDRIERVIGQKAPLSILFQGGATIEQLAATLRQSGRPVREQSLVSIQPAGSRPPLFLVHSASGNVMSYVALSRRLGMEQPVYGLQSKGLDADREPTARIEDMAAEYLDELLAVQPDGPYHLGGWSMGGVIAFEMARQLAAQGKSVAPIVLIDSYIQTGRVKKNGWDDVSLLLGLARHHGFVLNDGDEAFEDLRSLSLDEQIEFLLEKANGYNPFPLDVGIPQLRHQFELFKVNVHANERYRPVKSEQQIILLQAADTPRRQTTTVLKRWEKVAEVVKADRLPGDHFTMLKEPNVTLLAEQIKLHLSE